MWIFKPRLSLERRKDQGTTVGGSFIPSAAGQAPEGERRGLSGACQ